MIYGFDTEERDAAVAALVLYAVYRSRDRRRYKIKPDMWSQIERFTKAAAKRALTIPRFIESLKPRLCCETLSPRWMEAGIKGEIVLASRVNAAGNVEYMQPAAPPEQREFLTRVLAGLDQRAVIDLLYRETAWIVLLVRDRLEREKPIETRFEELAV